MRKLCSAEGRVLSLHFSSNPSSDGVPSVGFLDKAYLLTCEDQAFNVQWNRADNRTYQRHLQDFISGNVQEDAVRWIAPTLHDFLFADDRLSKLVSEATSEQDAVVQLTADSASQALLTDVPWEMTSLKSGGGFSYEDLLGYRALARVVDGSEVMPIKKSRICALYCISNPVSPTLRRFDSEVIEQMIEAVFQDYPAIDTRSVPGTDPRWPFVQAAIEGSKPHLFVLFGHGRSDNGTAELLFRDSWIRAQELADALKATKRNTLAVLVCCDLVRGGDSPGSQSGALTLVKNGLPSVLAMQGMVDAPVAKAFLDVFLNQLFWRTSVPVAAAAGRREMVKKSFLQGFLPTVFLNRRGSADFYHNALGHYREELRRLLVAFPAAKQDLDRPALQDTLDHTLDRTGLLVIRGGLGVGKTHLIQKVARRRLDGRGIPSRPIIKITCGRFAEGATLRNVSTSLADQLRMNAGLFSGPNHLPWEDAAALAEAVDQKNMIFVLDGFSVSREGVERKGLTEFLRHAGGLHKSLVVVIPETSASPVLPVEPPEIIVSVFKRSETLEYLQRFAPKLAGHYEAIQKWAGGSPLFLKALVRFQEQLARPAIRGGQAARRQLSVVADKYIRAVAGVLSAKELQTLCNLCYVPRAASVVWCRRLFDETEEQSAMPKLMEIGMLADGGENGELCYVPKAKAQAVRRVFRTKFRAGAQRITRRFGAWLEQQASVGDAVAIVGRSPGGVAVLQAVQGAYLKTGRHELAESLATLANVRGVSEEDLWSLYGPVRAQVVACYKRLVRRGRDSQDQRNRLGFLVRAAELAQVTGHEAEAESLLSDVMSFAEGYHRVVVLKTWAGFLKDTKQHAAISEIRAAYEEAIKIARAGTTQESGGEWRDLLREVLQERLNSRIFLEHALPQDLSEDIAELEGAGEQSRHLALVRCKLAERELEQEDQGVNWQFVAESLVGARRVLEVRGSLLDRSYCLYQYGQYLRRKPQPELGEAEDIYGQAEDLGRRGGDIRREGLALRQRARMQWRNLNSSGATPDAAQYSRLCADIEDMLARLEASARDSLSLRLLERLYTFRAAMGRVHPGDPVERWLLYACRVSADPLLAAEKDVRRCGRAFQRYLKSLLDRNWFVQAQGFVDQFRGTLREKLQVEPSVDDPVAVCEELSRRYSDQSRGEPWE